MCIKNIYVSKYVFVFKIRKVIVYLKESFNFLNSKHMTFFNAFLRTKAKLRALKV